MLIMLAAQAATVPVRRDPPPIIRQAVPMMVPTFQRDADAPIATRTIEIVARGGAALLWQGTLRVADRGGESGWSQTRSEPPAEPCSLRNYFNSGEREIFSVFLSAGSSDTPDRLSVRVKWTRRAEGSCDGIRTVEMSQTVALAAGKQTVVTGDGGLRLALRRR